MKAEYEHAQRFTNDSKSSLDHEFGTGHQRIMSVYAIFA